MEPEESRTTIRSRVEVQGTTGSGGGGVVVGRGVVVVGGVVVVVVGRRVVVVGGDDVPVTGGAVIEVVLTSQIYRSVSVSSTELHPAEN
jgi:predicted metalloprotease